MWLWSKHDSKCPLVRLKEVAKEGRQDDQGNGKERQEKMDRNFNGVPQEPASQKPRLTRLLLIDGT